ncbi:MAG: SDR family oxidoreductase [Gammaproteobacteria bacterium]
MTKFDESVVLIFGATRGTGLETARILTGRGDKVAAVVRPASDGSELEALGADVIAGDVMDADSVDAAFSSGEYRAVIISLGGKRGEPRPDLIGANHVVDAARRHGVQRALMITAIGCGDSKPAVAPKVIEVLGEILAAKTEAEDYLMESGLDATILRPGGMTSDPASGTAIKTDDHMTMGVINRADLARLTVDCLDDDATIGRIFHTVDPEITWEAPLQRGDDTLHRKR